MGSSSVKHSTAMPLKEFLDGAATTHAALRFSIGVNPCALVRLDRRVLPGISEPCGLAFAGLIPIGS